jgi:hypothetical protein
MIIKTEIKVFVSFFIIGSSFEMKFNLAFQNEICYFIIEKFEFHILVAT